MDYSKAKTQLLKIFEELEYERLALAEKQHAVQYPIYECSTGNKVIISFPGHKYNKGKYDYAVRLQTDKEIFTLSHANIIVDIVEKVKTEMAPAQEITRLLECVATQGKDPILPKPLTNSPPVQQDILKSAENTHRKYGKTFGINANVNHLNWEDLVHSIFWISLQEDINYPMPRFEGRKMPFARYCEAVWAASEWPERLPLVLSRALSHSRPYPLTGVRYLSL